jgi:hypothetical protein
MIQWKVAEKQNFGLDLQLWEALSLTVDFFKEHRDKILIQSGLISELQGIPRGNFAFARNKVKYFDESPFPENYACRYRREPVIMWKVMELIGQTISDTRLTRSTAAVTSPHRKNWHGRMALIPDRR